MYNVVIEDVGWAYHDHSGFAGKSVKQRKDTVKMKEGT